MKSIAVAAFLALGCAPVEAGILVLSPHPDDDIITSAGVIRREVGQEEVTVVYMTNGESAGQGTTLGLRRQGEAVAAQVDYLGTAEDNLIFLGYPNGHLLTIYNNYRNATDQFFTSFGQGVTYGNRGLGRMDYHSFRFGAPAAYNLPNMVLDLATILQTYRPAHVYTTSEFDTHEDHATTYQVLRLALDNVRLADPTYSPVIHKTIVWTTKSGLWPTAIDPTAYHGLMPGLAQTALSWQDRASLDVPLSMQDLNLLANLKYRAIWSHKTQTGSGFIQRFTHKDEVFWSENPFGANQPPVAHAGTDVFSQPGQQVVLDGSGSRDPEAGQLSYQWLQRSGSPVTLGGGNTAYPEFTIPAAAAAGDVWAFQLTVSDGTFASARDMVHVYAGTPAANIAPQASAAASSENVGGGQLAGKAIDRLVSGFPLDSKLEWASTQTVGAWIRLTWAEPMLVTGVRLHDRPGLNDWITGGTLSFSDGTSVAVGSLNNDGVVGTQVAFTPRTVTSLTFTVTSAGSSTQRAGLAELLVFGQPAAPP